jgi:hypothetical protein
MRAFTFVPLFVALATPALAVPVSDRIKRESGEFDYVVIGVSTPTIPPNSQKQHIEDSKIKLCLHYFRVARQVWLLRIAFPKIATFKSPSLKLALLI